MIINPLKSIKHSSVMNNNDSFLSTKRLFFSHWLTQDYDKALKLWGNPNVTRFIANINSTEKDVKKLLEEEIQNESEHGVQYWPFYSKSSHEFIGCCGLAFYPLIESTYELGCHICEEFWGNRFAEEASIAVIKYAFLYLNAEALFARHNPNNVSSKNILLRLGFKYTGTEYLESTQLYHPAYLLNKADFEEMNKTSLYKAAEVKFS